MSQIRGKSIVIFEHNDKYLFTVCYEHERKETFYIPVGGGIEFGEHSLDAAKREVMEEIGQETKNERLLEITENIFTYNGIAEHEIVFIYSAEFKNPNAYTDNLKGNINAEGKQIKLVWASLKEIRQNNIRLFPSSLSALLSVEFESKQKN
jgi:8-oxo-dGTP pyrophosphatase MutT (NUDIX family)